MPALKIGTLIKYDKKLLSLFSSPMAIGTIVYPGARIPSRTPWTGNSYSRTAAASAEGIRLLTARVAHWTQIAQKHSARTMNPACQTSKCKMSNALG